MQISQKQFETWYQLPTNRTDQMMMSSMTSRDRERSRSWCQYFSGLLFRKRLERLGYNGATIGNGTHGIEWSRDRW